MIKRVFNKLGISRSYGKNVNGKTFKVPIINGLGFANFANTEPWMDQILKKLGSNETSILDVGVNVGQTLMKWKSQFPKSEYLGIEPNVACVHYVNTLIQKNGIKNATVLPVGLGNKAELNFLYTSDDPSDIAATTIKDFRSREEKASPIISVGFDLIGERKFDLIKIDVEGAEADVIDSIFAQLPENHPTFICEILPVYDAAKNPDRLSRQQRIESVLQSNDYSLYRIVHEGSKILLEELQEVGVHGDLNRCEYLFVHNSKKESVISAFQ